MWRSHLMGWVTGTVCQVVGLPGKKSKIGECIKTRGWRKKQWAFENLTCPHFLGHCPDTSHRASQACSQGHCSSEQHCTWGCHLKDPEVAADWEHHTDTYLQVTAVIHHRSAGATCWCGPDCSFWMESSFVIVTTFFFFFNNIRF